MKIDRKPNIVIPLIRDDATVYIHSVPIGRQVFEANYLIIAKTCNAIYTQGLGTMAGPRVAFLTLRDIARNTESWEGPGGVELSLVAEIRRLTTLVAPGADGWQQTPYQEAVDKKLMTEDEISEVDNALVYFTVASSMYRRDMWPVMLDGALLLWGGRTELSTCTEFVSSLTTSTTAESSGEATT